MSESADRYAEGLQIRREVLGEEFIDAAMASVDDFTEPFQDLLNEYCYGAVWARPGLTRATRSLLNIGMLCALNRPHELHFHVIGALRNGCSREEIREVLLQAAVYCGMPAGVEGFRIAGEVFNEWDKDGASQA